MDARSWQNVLRSIRAEDQTTIVVRTVDALEIAVEAIAKIEDELVLIRGRIAGSADARRLFLLPYDKLSALYVNRMVASEEVELFSPSVNMEEKKKLFDEWTRKQEEEKAKLSAPRPSLSSDNDLKSEIEELKRMAGRPGMTQPAAAQEPAELAGATPNVIATPVAPALEGGQGKRLAIPGPAERRPGGGRLSLPDRPRGR